VIQNLVRAPLSKYRCSVCNNILPQYGNMNLHIICKIYARYESCKECSYTNSHRCQSNYRVNVATVVHVALSSLCSYWAQYEQYIVANTVSLIKPPPYIALSYCWGVGKSYSAFCLDRQSVDITPNLSVAIQQAQNTVYARKTKTFLLWVDAVYL
jgi:hypothetical protein